MFSQVGAGRGPLVRATLRAGVSSNRDLRVYAIEKNPNAVITCVFTLFCGLVSHAFIVSIAKDAS